jgi:Protein of unknown function (DUF2933)
MLIGATASGGLLLLAVLACPIGMGLMMLFMGRGMMGGRKQSVDQDEPGRATLAEMKAEQARLAEKIDALEAKQPQAEPAERASEREPDRVS